MAKKVGLEKAEELVELGESKEIWPDGFQMHAKAVTSIEHIAEAVLRKGDPEAYSTALKQICGVIRKLKNTRGRLLREWASRPEIQARAAKLKGKFAT